MSNTQYIDTGVDATSLITSPYHPSINLYSLKDYDGDDLIHDYIPCTNSEGVSGCYDTITGKFKDKESMKNELLERLKKADKVEISWR